MLAILLPALALPAVAMQASAAGAAAPELAESAVQSTEQVKMSIFPPDWQEGDWPELLAFKGVAVKDGRLVSAVFLAIRSEGSDFDQTTLIIDGKSSDLAAKNISRYPKNGAIVLSFDRGTLLLKRYQFNYADTLVASGEYDGWQLNMRIIGNEPVYRVMYAAEKAVGAPESVQEAPAAQAE